MVGPSTRNAYKARAHTLVVYLENRTKWLRDEMKKQNVEMYPPQRSFFSEPTETTAHSELTETIVHPTTITLRVEDVRGFIQGIYNRIAEMRRFEKWSN